MLGRGKAQVCESVIAGQDRRPEDSTVLVDAKSVRFSGGALPTGDETVLVVEDRLGVRRFACRILRRLGYRTYEAEDSADAMSILSQHQDIDLLFSDIVMPGDTDGRQLAHLAIGDRPVLKVLLTTGMEPMKADRQESEEKFIVLTKPYSAEELARKIRAALDADAPGLGRVSS